MFFLYLVKRQQVRGIENLPTDISPVINACEHALLATHPQPRYLVGSDAVVMAILAKLPEFIADWILVRRLKLTELPFIQSK